LPTIIHHILIITLDSRSKMRNYFWLVLLSITIQLTHAQTYEPDDIPDPRLDPTSCHRSTNTSYICNIDQLITNEEANSFDVLASSLEYQSTNFTCDNETAGIQLGALIVQKVTFETGEEKADAVERFALAVHNAWGVGDYRCDNGAMIVISIEDRYTYITTGDGVLSLQPELPRIIDDSKSYMQAGDYGGGLLYMADEISKFLLSHPTPPPANPPSNPGGSFDDDDNPTGLYIALGIIGGVILIVILFGIMFATSSSNSSRVANTATSATRTTGVPMSPYNTVTPSPSYESVISKARKGIQTENEEIVKITKKKGELTNKIELILSQWTDKKQKLCTKCVEEITAGQNYVTMPCGHIYHGTCPQDMCQDCPSQSEREEVDPQEEITDYSSEYYYEYSDEFERVVNPLPIPPVIFDSNYIDGKPYDWLTILIQIQLHTLYLQNPTFMITGIYSYAIVYDILHKRNSIQNMMLKFLALHLITEAIRQHQQNVQDYQNSIDAEEERKRREAERARQAREERERKAAERRARQAEYDDYDGGYGGGGASTGYGGGWGGFGTTNNDTSYGGWGGGGGSTGFGGGWGGGGNDNDYGGGDWGGGGASDGGGGGW
jgi:uncharacterized membrane protein YgcG